MWVLVQKAETGHDKQTEGDAGSDGASDRKLGGRRQHLGQPLGVCSLRYFTSSLGSLCVYFHSCCCHSKNRNAAILVVFLFSPCNWKFTLPFKCWVSQEPSGLHCVTSEIRMDWVEIVAAMPSRSSILTEQKNYARYFYCLFWLLLKSNWYI